MFYEDDAQAMNDPGATGTRLPDELRPVEATLATLTPRCDRLSPEQLWFEAGRRAALEAAPQRNTRWMVAGASTLSAAAAVAATLLLMHSIWPQAEIARQIQPRVPVAVQMAEQAPTALSPANRSRDGAPGEGTPGDRVGGDTGGGDAGADAQPAAVPTRLTAAEPRGFRAAQLEAFVLLFHHGADWTDLSGQTQGGSRALGGGEMPPVEEQPTYFQQRQALLGNAPHNGARPDLHDASTQGA